MFEEYECYEKVKEINIPIPMHKNRIMTINNWATVHWSAKSKIKNEFKSLLRDWFLDEDEELNKSCVFVWEPTYKDNRKRDSINLASVSKIIEDTIVEIGCMPDDDETEHFFKTRKVDKNIVQHTLNLKIYTKGNTKWIKQNL